MDENNNVVVRVPEQQFVRGEDGYSPVVTIEEIEHGHSVNITDREHQEEGQTFNVLDGASAYEQAVAGGYTKSETQFNAELGSFGELSEETKEAAPFYAVYGVTTKEEIAAAVNNKRQIFVRFDNEVTLVIPYFGTINYVDYQGQRIGYRFLGTDGALQHAVTLTSGWSHYYNNLNEPAQRAEDAADAALNRMNSANESAERASRARIDASRYANTAYAEAIEASIKAGEASDSATAADGSAKDAEAYAVGKRGGTDVGSTDPAYHNNAKYYAEQAASSASDAVTAKGAAETAQGKAEDAQEAAEQAQEAAEAVLESIPSDYTDLSDDVDDLKSAIDDIDAGIYGTCALEWTDGLYGASGYVDTKKWMYSNILQPGTYTIDVPDSFRYQVFKYISDAQGEAIETNVQEDKTYTVTEPIIISTGLISGGNLTNDDKNTIQNTFVVTDDNKSLVKSVERNEEEIASLRSDLTNSNLRYYAEEVSRNQSTFVYFAGGNAIASGLKVNRVNLKIIHPSVSTSPDIRGVGLLIAGLYKNGEGANLLTNRDIFPQDHSTEHKMTVIIDIFTMPYMIVGKADYYVDDVYSKSFDIELTSETELDGIYGVGVYFNTDNTTNRTYKKTGMLYQGGTVIA